MGQIRMTSHDVLDRVVSGRFTLISREALIEKASRKNVGGPKSSTASVSGVIYFSLKADGFYGGVIRSATKLL